MKPYYIIEKDNVFYKVLREETESNEQFYNRCNFISNKKPNKNNFDEIIELSKIYRNIQFLNVSYDKDILDKLKI